MMPASPRPTWQAGVSVCPELPGFVLEDLYPIRSPLIVADYLSERVRGKSFCEIGTRNGDVMGCVSRSAASVTAIEMDEAYCSKLRQRGFGVACQKIEDIPVPSFPLAHVYYWWPSDAGGQNELWLRIVARALRVRGWRASVYIGFDAHWKPDLDYLPGLVKKYNGTVSRLFFDEGGAVRGPAVGSDVYRLAAHKLEASIQKPFFDRPGHWGVFHVGRFDIGPEMWRRMRAIPFHHPEFVRGAAALRTRDRPQGLGRRMLQERWHERSRRMDEWAHIDWGGRASPLSPIGSRAASARLHNQTGVGG